MVLQRRLPLSPQKKKKEKMCLILCQRFCVINSTPWIPDILLCCLCCSCVCRCLRINSVSDDCAVTSIYCEWFQGTGIGNLYTSSNSLIFGILVSHPFYREYNWAFHIIGKWQRQLKSQSEIYVLISRSFLAFSTIILASGNQIPYLMRLE